MAGAWTMSSASLPPTPVTRSWRRLARLAVIIAVGCPGTLFAPAQARADGGKESKPSPSSNVRVAGVVLKWVRGDKEANFRRVEPLIREAVAGGARIVCTTECF